MPSHPVKRSLADLRERGYTCAIAERYNAHAKRRFDLFGFIDIVAIGNGEIVGVQTTRDTHLTSHREKILSEPNAKLWLESGGKIELHAVAKRRNKLMSVRSIRRAQRLYSDGTTQKALAEEYGVSVDTLRKALREGDLPTNETWELKKERITLAEIVDE